MNFLNIFRFIFCSFAIMASLDTHAYPGESIVLDPSTGDYIITYWDEEEPASLEKGTFIPSTKIEPSVQSKFRMNESGSVTYRYKVRSSSSSRQLVGTFRFNITQSIIGSQDWPKANRETITEAQLAAVYDANNAALATPHGWSGGISSRKGHRISWHPSHVPENGIRPSLSQEGFGFSSYSLPGVGLAQLEGERPPRGWSGHGPTEKSAIKTELERLEDNDFVTRPAAVPTIAVPEPFDAAITLEHIQSHMHTWIAMQLLDPAFSAQLDRSFQSAISAYRLNQPKVGKQHIRTMRKLIKKEHADADREDGNDDRDEKDNHDNKNKRALIDKLAARILDFNLKYVTKHMGGEKDD